MGKQFLVTIVDKDEKKERNVTKPLGRPKIYSGENKRRSFTTMMRQSLIDKIEKQAEEEKKTVATVLDEILSKVYK